MMPTAPGQATTIVASSSTRGYTSGLIVWVTALTDRGRALPISQVNRFAP